VAMLFCQLGRDHSLREICQGLAASGLNPFILPAKARIWLRI
jgi:hypothetical protein